MEQQRLWLEGLPDQFPVVSSGANARQGQSQGKLPGFEQSGKEMVLPGEQNERQPASGDSWQHQAPERRDQSSDFAVHLLALGRIRGIGVQTLRVLIDRYQELRKVWQVDVRDLAEALHSARVRESRDIATMIHERQAELLADGQRACESLAKRGIKVIGAHDQGFPAQLLSHRDAPYWLFVQGNVEVLCNPAAVAIVGTREPSQYGAAAARRLASIVIQEGLGVVSGLAEGIDAEAHRVAAYYGVPQVAVLGTGINLVFPTSTSRLRDKIVEDGGAVVTEYFPDDRYDRVRFVQRNRIQAGLAVATCPVESRVQSGTAHTLRFAVQYERAVFGVVRGPVAGGNEILEELKTRRLPIFDLSSEKGVSSLREFLRALPGQRRSSPEQPMPDRLFKDLLKALDELAAVVPLSPSHIDWLVAKIKQRYGATGVRTESGNDS